MEEQQNPDDVCCTVCLAPVPDGAPEAFDGTDEEGTPIFVILCLPCYHAHLTR